MKSRFLLPLSVALLISFTTSQAQAPAPVAPPPPPAPEPFKPQPVVPGGIVVTLYAAGSPHLRAGRVAESERTRSRNWTPGQISNVGHIQNPSIEFHAANPGLNTGAVVIVAAGGLHSLNLGSEGNDFVPFLGNQGVSTVILRYRLGFDGYPAATDGLGDMLQAIRQVRAHAAEWHVDPARIGVLGFGEGAELATSATLLWAGADQRNEPPDNLPGAVSSRPDFAAIVYPGPSPLVHGPLPIPRDAPPVFIACAASGDWMAAGWANQYFSALLQDGVPNIEMHLYGRGHHPGDKVGPDEPPAGGGLTNMGNIGYGAWSVRYLEWLRDLGFLDTLGAETRAARDVKANLARTPHTTIGQPPPPPAPRPTLPPKTQT